MGFFRVSNPSGVTAVNLYDLGVIVAPSAVNYDLSAQFTVEDLVRSADLESNIISAALTVQIDYGIGFQSISAVGYTNRDALSAYLNVFEISNENNNEKLVDGSEVNTGRASDSGPLHIHDARYFTKAILQSTAGAGDIGDNPSTWTVISGANVQAALNSIDAAFITAVTLDKAYHNDDGILEVNDAAKPLDFQSNGINDIFLSRKAGADYQRFVRVNNASNELSLGALAAGALPVVPVHVLTSLTVDGDITFTGKITDTTTSNLQVNDSNIFMRYGAVAGGDATLQVVRGSSGASSDLLWSESALRWKAGLVGSEQTIALLEANETVSGRWLFNPATATDPNMLFADRSSAPTTGLGAAGQTPVVMMPSGMLATYDKSNSRNKFLSVARMDAVFSGRASGNNKNEYAYLGQVNSFETGLRLPAAMTLVAITAQLQNSGTVNVRIRSNGSATNLATLTVTAATGATDTTTNLDFAANDQVQVFLDTGAGAGVAAPVIHLVFAYKY